MKITKQIHLLRHDFKINMAPGVVLKRFVNTIIIFGEKIALIDTGVKDSYEFIKSYIAQEGRSIEEVNTIILSHSHPDHIGCAGRIKAASGCRVLAHRAEQNWIENISLQEHERPVPGFLQLVEEPVTIDEFIVNNQHLDAGYSVPMKLIHSPGHSRGSMNIEFPGEGILFTADSIINVNDIPNYEDFSEQMESLGKIKNNSQFTTLLSSWSEPLFSRAEADIKIGEAEDYLLKIDLAVRNKYKNEADPNLICCTEVVKDLGLPPGFVSCIVDAAFRSHIRW